LQLEYLVYPALVVVTLFVSRIVWNLADKTAKKLLNEHGEVCKYENEIKAMLRRQEELREDKLPEIQKTIAILSERYETVIENINKLADKLEKALDECVKQKSKG
jgi:DNA-binding ferritin-like protein